MKKGFSIFLSLLMLAAVMHFSIATHYCGGKEVASKLSLSGKLANCGMEASKKELPFPGTNITIHCCDDAVTLYGLNCNYAPSFSFLQGSYQNSFKILNTPIVFSVYSLPVLKTLNTNVSPPGDLMSTNVDLHDICVFRI
jgi:hypothetical protein